MKKNIPSHTAELATMTRAVARHCKSVSQIMYDEYAHLFIGPSVIVPYVYHRAQLKCFGVRAWEKGMLALGYMFAVCRHRFMHDFIDRAVKEGFIQVVILGAGYDTYGLQQGSQLKECTIFEVDHPTTQHRKCSIIKKKDIRVPDNIRYIACDLAGDDLAKALTQTGFKYTRPTCVIAEGLVSYFRYEKIEELLRGICQLAEVVTIAADYRSPKVRHAHRGSIISRWRESFRRANEQYQTFFDSNSAGKTFSQAGFTLINQFGLTELSNGTVVPLTLPDELNAVSEIYTGISDKIKKHRPGTGGQVQEHTLIHDNTSVCAIVNNKRNSYKLKCLCDDLVRSGINVLKTRHAGHAIHLAKEAHRYTTLLAIGGDGTVNEVINGMDLENQTLGVVSAGTVNCLARVWGVKGDKLTWDKISRREIKQVDLLQCILKSASQQTFQRYVLAFLALGHEAQVASLVQRLGKTRLKMYYPVANFLSTFMLPDHRATISINNTSPDLRRITSLLMSNADSSLFSSINRWSQDDGTFEVQIAKRNILTQFFHNVRILIPFDIGTTYQSGVTSCHIILEQPANLTADGELFPDIVELRIKIMPAALRVVIP
jgi:methyltransferase (TIGR00027 family)